MLVAFQFCTYEGSGVVFIGENNALTNLDLFSVLTYPAALQDSELDFESSNVYVQRLEMEIK
jgi:hypothetical protein